MDQNTLINVDSQKKKMLILCQLYVNMASHSKERAFQMEEESADYSHWGWLSMTYTFIEHTYLGLQVKTKVKEHNFKFQWWQSF